VKPSSVALLFRAVALAEACSWLLLLGGMFVKYVLADSERGVQIFGPVHGGVFLLYLAVTVLAWRSLRWDLRTAFLALVASVPPLATIWLDRWATRSGALPVPEPVPAP
jgi:integral membrane protein